VLGNDQFGVDADASASRSSAGYACFHRNWQKHVGGKRPACADSCKRNGPTQLSHHSSLERTKSVNPVAIAISSFKLIVNKSAIPTISSCASTVGRPRLCWRPAM